MEVVRPRGRTANRTPSSRPPSPSRALLRAGRDAVGRPRARLLRDNPMPRGGLHAWRGAAAPGKERKRREAADVFEMPERKLPWERFPINPPTQRARPGEARRAGVARDDPPPYH